jgi:hypothetical protein
MSLPPESIDWLFARLATRYGELFARQYRDLDLDVVKRDWLHTLADTDRFPNAWRWAIANLPTEKPPLAGQFLALIRQAPRELDSPTTPALEAPAVDRARVAAALAGINAQKPAKHASHAAQCIDRIREVTNGGKMSAAQKHVYDACMRMLHGKAGGAEQAAA